MALSNWDTLALDLNGNSTNGIFRSPLGVGVEIYKNYLNIHDEKAWVPGAFTTPVILQIQFGDIQYKDIKITAIRGPQEGIFIVLYVGKPVYGKDEKGKRVFKELDYDGMIGCGVYGHTSENYVGVSQESLDFLQRMISEDLNNDPLYQKQNKELVDQMALTSDVEKEKMLLEFRSKPVFKFPEKVAKINLIEKSPLRFNQGDAYFASHTGREIPTTPVDESGKDTFLGIFTKEKR